jgi:hypothetical protein
VAAAIPRLVCFNASTGKCKKSLAILEYVLIYRSQWVVCLTVICRSASLARLWRILVNSFSYRKPQALRFFCEPVRDYPGRPPTRTLVRARPIPDRGTMRISA